MRIRLLVAMKVRDEKGNSRILYPGIFDDSKPDFPEVLRSESRPGIVEVLDSPVSVPGSPVPDESESDITDPDDESNEDIGESVEEEADIEKPSKKKDKIKRRG